MEKKNQIQETISLIMKYNRQMYEYGKDFRSYGTDKMFAVDQMSIINLIGDNPKCNLKLIGPVHLTPTSPPYPFRWRAL